MSYEVFILKRAQWELSHLPIEDYERVKKAILNFRENPRPRGVKKLMGRVGWRIRVGNFRVIYEIDEGQKTVTVLHVGHRRDVYER